MPTDAVGMPKTGNAVRRQSKGPTITLWEKKPNLISFAVMIWFYRLYDFAELFLYVDQYRNKNKPNKKNLQNKEIPSNQSPKKNKPKKKKKRVKNN